MDDGSVVPTTTERAPSDASRARVSGALGGAARRLLPRLLMREYGIAGGAGVLMASFLLSALLGAIRQVLFNAQFGAEMEANAYYAAFRLPDTLFSLIAGGALSSAMIPVLVSAEREAGVAAAARLTNLVLTTLLATLALVVLVGELFAPPFVTHLLAPGFDRATGRLTVTLTRIMLVQILILAVGSVATAVLNSRNQFLLTGLSVASHNLALIGGIAAARIEPGIGIYGPTFGVVAGAVLQVLILLPGIHGRRLRYRLTWDLSDRRLHDVVRLLIPNGLSVGVGYAGFIVDTAFASKAPEHAGLAAIHNAWLLAALPITLLGQAVSQSAFPQLAAHAAARRWPEMRRTLLRALAGALVLTLPAVLLLIFLGRQAVRILFEHGKFSAADGSLTYAVLVPYAMGLPAYVATEMITRGLIALRDTRTPLLTNTLQLCVRVALVIMLLPRIGVVAIPIAFALSAAAETLALGTVLRWKLRRRTRAGGRAL